MKRDPTPQWQLQQLKICQAYKCHTCETICHRCDAPSHGPINNLRESLAACYTGSCSSAVPWRSLCPAPDNEPADATPEF